MNDIFTNASIDRQRLMKFGNLTLHILRTEPSVVIAEDSLHWIFAILGCISNALLVAVIFKSRKELLQYSSNILLLNLSTANLAYLLTSIALKIHSHTMQEDAAASNLVMKVSSVVTECEALLSNWTVATLAIFNFLGVVLPMKVKALITRKTTFTVIAISWIFAIGLIVPLAISSNPRGIVVNGRLSQDYFTTSFFDVLLIYGIVLDTISKGPPLLSIVVLYPMIVFTLNRRRKENGRSEHFRNKLGHSIARVSNIYIVFVAYISLDLTVSVLFHYFMYSDILDKPLSTYSYSLLKFITAVMVPFQLFHTILNPFLHALLTENYRKYYLPLLCNCPKGYRKKSEKRNSISSNKSLNQNGK